MKNIEVKTVRIDDESVIVNDEYHAGWAFKRGNGVVWSVNKETDDESRAIIVRGYTLRLPYVKQDLYFGSHDALKRYILEEVTDLAPWGMHTRDGLEFAERRVLDGSEPSDLWKMFDFNMNMERLARLAPHFME